MVTDTIDDVHRDRHPAASGAELDADIVVAATGLSLLAARRDGADGGRRAGRRWPRRSTYKGMMLSGVPNFALAIGYTNASWTLQGRPGQRVRLPAARPRWTAPAAPSSTPLPPPPGAARAAAQPAGQLHQARPGRAAAAGQRRGRGGSTRTTPRTCCCSGTARSPTRSSSADAPVRRSPAGVAVVTGAASGIGAALAVELARRGSRLVLLDRDARAAGQGGRARSAPRPGSSTSPTVPPSSRWARRSGRRTRGCGCWSTTPASRSAAGSTRSRWPSTRR